MYSKVCSCLLKQVMFYTNKLYVWLVKRILKITLWQVLWLILIIAIFLLLWNRYPCDKKYFKESNNPVILWWTEGFPSSSETRDCPNNIKCDVYSDRNISKHLNVQAYLFYGSNIKFNDLPLPRRPKDFIWGLYHEESPRNVQQLMHEPVLRLFNYSSTFSRYSDVPFPLQYLESLEDIISREYFVETSEKNFLLEKIAPILYLQSDCETSTERDLYVKELMKLSRVDSYGSCLNNKKLPEKFTTDYLNNLNEEEFLMFVARYKFVIAIENGVCDDYVTEKFWRAIKVGTVPIYFGSPLIKDWLPNERSAILLEDYPTPSILNDQLDKLLNNDILYEQYLEHKTMQIVRNARLTKEFNENSYQVDSLLTTERFECFVCGKIHDRMKGGTDEKVVSKSHYNCPKPTSALQLDINPKNSWVDSYDYNRKIANEIYKKVMVKV